MTNREKIREIFPNVIFIYRKEEDKTNAIMCSDEWLDSEYIEPLEQEPTFDKIKKVVAKWKADNFTDGFAWDCMQDIADIIDKAESEAEDGNEAV